MPPLILIGLPGAGAGGPWLIHWNILFARLLQEYRVVLCYGMGANIYSVRNDCIPVWDSLPMRAEYMLWIDSDNLVTYEAFEQLRTALETNTELDMVAGWAWTQDAMGHQRPKISAGQWKNPRNLQHREIEEAIAADRLIRVDWTGLCFALIRANKLKPLGPQPFLPIPVRSNGKAQLLSEDESFCLLAGQMGLKFAVHPGVKVPHLKPKPIEPDQDSKIEIKVPEVIAQGYAEETGESKPEEVVT